MKQLYTTDKLYAQFSADGGSVIDVTDIPRDILKKIQDRLNEAAGKDDYAPHMDVVAMRKNAEYIITNTGYPNENADDIIL